MSSAAGTACHVLPESRAARTSPFCVQTAYATPLTPISSARSEAPPPVESGVAGAPTTLPFWIQAAVRRPSAPAATAASVVPPPLSAAGALQPREPSRDSHATPPLTYTSPPPSSMPRSTTGRAAPGPSIALEREPARLRGGSDSEGRSSATSRNGKRETFA